MGNGLSNQLPVGAELRGSAAAKRGRRRIGSSPARSFPVLSAGAVAFGAFAVGALSIGVFAIGRLLVRRARIDQKEIGVLSVGKNQLAGQASVTGSP